MMLVPEKASYFHCGSVSQETKLPFSKCVHQSQERFPPVPGGTLLRSRSLCQGLLCAMPSWARAAASRFCFAQKAGLMQTFKTIYGWTEFSLQKNKAPLCLHPVRLCWLLLQQLVPSPVNRLSSVKTKCLYSNGKSKDLWDPNVYILHLLKDTGCISSPPSWYLQAIFCTILAAMEN